jgi:hypothetical protein
MFQKIAFFVYIDSLHFFGQFEVTSPLKKNTKKEEKKQKIKTHYQHQQQQPKAITTTKKNATMTTQ